MNEALEAHSNGEVWSLGASEGRQVTGLYQGLDNCRAGAVRADPRA
jgi:hypothetical protein